MLNVIPVIDLKDGWVVRAVQGRRESYRPVDSCLTSDARPGAVARALVERLGATQAYVADINAIEGRPVDLESLGQIAAAGLRMLVDAGAATAERAAPLLQTDFGQSRLAAIVMGSESIACLHQLEEAVDLAGPERSVFSLDLLAGRPITRLPRWRHATAKQIVDDVGQLGFRRIIVLDLASVGIDHGVSTLPLCRELRTRLPDWERITGGGVRNRADLLQLAQAGCHAALVGSALHDGRIGRGDLQVMSEG